MSRQISDNQVRIVFQPSGRCVWVTAGVTILEAAAQAGLTLETPCGGQGTCAKCRVQVTTGAAEANAIEQKDLGDLAAKGWRLACQSPITQPCTIFVPEGTLFAGGQQILAQAHEGGAHLHPAVQKIRLDLPALAPGQSQHDRLARAIGPFRADPSLAAALDKLSTGGVACTAVKADHTLIDVEPGDTSGQSFGVAFDIGTTTLVGALLDLNTGAELAIASRMNPQISCGDDVVSRIHHASTPAGAANLHRLVTAAVGEMVGELCRQANIRPQHVYEISFAGNTTMQHLLCDLDVAPLGRAPFEPASTRSQTLPAAKLGVPIHPRGLAYVFPVIGGFVGGDTVAGMLATRLESQEGPVLMVDIGTNGEIVLAHDGKLLAASTAAGPAFEGARIACGMRAAAGAIEKVQLDGAVHCGVIGNQSPIGLCGSGLIDAAAQLLDIGLVTSAGRMLLPGELPDAIPEHLRRRVTLDGQGQVQFVLAQGPVTVTLTQKDIRELQLACGAIRAGIAILLRQAGVAAGDLRRIYLAGGFGSFIRRNHAQRLGLLPTEVDHARIVYVGNASLSGARWALLSTDVRTAGETLAARTGHVELAHDPQFQMEFAEAMIFPEK